MFQTVRCWTMLAIFGLLITFTTKGFAQPVPVLPPDAPPPTAAPFDLPADARPVLPEGARLAPMGGEIGPEEAKPAKDCVRMQTQDGSLIIGQVAEDTKLKLRAKIGEVEIPLKEVARIDRAVEENQFQVTLANGDRLTGRLTMEEAKLTAVWGDVPLAVKTLASLEAGKLYEATVHEARRSPDGRSVVTVARKRFQFVPTIEDPNENVYPSTTPQPRWQPGSATPSFGTPTAPVPRASRSSENIQRTHGGVI